jgi:hypothetical protein
MANSNDNLLMIYMNTTVLKSRKRISGTWDASWTTLDTAILPSTATWLYGQQHGDLNGSTPFLTFIVGSANPYTLYFLFDYYSEGAGPTIYINYLKF